MRYEGNIFRPPGEWKSYLLQATVGCSHNKCTFCSMYKDKKYYERPLKDVLEDIDMAYGYYGPDLRRVFICDGDAIKLPTEYLLTVLKRLYEKFPNLEKVTTYAGPQSTLEKTSEELKAFVDAGLKRAYLGVETGDGELLMKRGKGVGADKMLEAGLALKEAGFDLWCTVIIGLAGRGEASRRHIEKTVELMNKMQPQHLSALTIMMEPGTPLYKDWQRGKFEVPTDIECLEEARGLIAGLECEGLHFTSNHASNYVPINCTLSRDRDKYVEMLTDIIDNHDRSRIRKDKYRRL